MRLVMHIYHKNNSYIHSAVQNLNIAINCLHKADKEAYIAEAVRTVVTQVREEQLVRVEAGTASSENAKASAAGARPLAELAWKFAQQA